MKLLLLEVKRLATLAERGLDMHEGENGFDFDRALTFSAHPSRTGRERVGFIGRLNGRDTVVVILSPLDTEGAAIVSLRPANKKERLAYDERT